MYVQSIADGNGETAAAVIQSFFLIALSAGCSSADSTSAGDAGGSGHGSGPDGAANGDSASAGDDGSGGDAGNTADGATAPDAAMGADGGPILDGGMWMPPLAVNLGSAGGYVILAKSGISNVPTSAVTGDLGLSPAAATYITGFPLTADSTNTFPRRRRSRARSTRPPTRFPPRPTSRPPSAT